MIFLQILFLIVGFAMLIFGADWFVDGSSSIAKRMGIPQIVVGLTIVAMGTSAPEAAVSISAATKGVADIAVGNVWGSNILNIFIILGITVLIRNIKIQKNTLWIEIPILIAITAILIGFGMTGETVGRFEAIILLLIFIGYLIYLFILAKKGSVKDAEPEEPEKKVRPYKKKLWFQLLSILAGAVIIVWGSNIAVDAATAIAEAIGIDDRFIGLTVVALGTSLPELVTSVMAARKGNADIAIGNVVGSCIFNILFVLGVSAVITPVAYPAPFLIDGLVSIAAGVLLFLSVLKSKELKRGWGIVFLLGYVAYFIYLL